ncbi:hypothetical protein [uncultured Sanguibacteroides sp.]|uniref:hypothetical protein n=1 Tax=uncultured Sanguibacteroides sp. TaxID=1635151 RepID=UPI0025E1E186|nr:hypothetical protein [uncultured Sanguibacteroides sp.]
MAQSNMLFKWLLTSSFVFIISFTQPLFSQEFSKNNLFSYKEVDVKPTLRIDRHTSFSQWIVNKINHKEIPFQYKPSEGSSPYHFFIFSDSSQIYHKIDVVFTVKSNGKVGDIEVEKTNLPILEEEVVKVLSLSPKWNVGYHDKRKVNTRIRTTLIFELKGNPVKLDKEPLYYKAIPRNNSGKGATISHYIYDIATALNSPKNDSIQGKLELSFIIDKTGHFTLLGEKQNLYPVDYALFYRNHSSAGGLFHKDTQWEPARISDRPVSIKVVATIDYDKQVYEYDCYLIQD